MAVVQVIENGGARLEVNVVTPGPLSGSMGEVSINLLHGKSASITLDAEDLKALIKRCRTVLAEIEG